MATVLSSKKTSILEKIFAKEFFFWSKITRLRQWLPKNRYSETRLINQIDLLDLILRVCSVFPSAKINSMHLDLTIIVVSFLRETILL